MEHSTNYNKVKNWYGMKMWNEVRVRNAVKMGWITEEECSTILGVITQAEADELRESTVETP